MSLVLIFDDQNNLLARQVFPDSADGVGEAILPAGGVARSVSGLNADGVGDVVAPGTDVRCLNRGFLLLLKQKDKAAPNCVPIGVC